MLKKYLALGLVLLSTLAHSSEFSGSWSGEGMIVELSTRSPIEAFFQVTVEFNEDKLSVEQCQTHKDGQSPSECFSSTYKVVNDAIFSQFDEKIGDIFPSKMIIFESNSQVSEQFQFHLNAKGEMRFNYSYSNLDGDSIHKRAYLTKE